MQIAKMLLFVRRIFLDMEDEFTITELQYVKISKPKQKNLVCLLKSSDIIIKTMEIF